MKKKGNEKQNKIIIYTDKHGNVELKADVEKETIWATLDQIADLFGRDKSVISRHLKNIFNESELDIKATVANTERIKQLPDKILKDLDEKLKFIQQTVQKRELNREDIVCRTIQSCKT